MSSYIISFGLLNRLLWLIVFFFAFESQAQIINSSRGEQIQLYIYIRSSRSMLLKQAGMY